MKIITLKSWLPSRMKLVNGELIAAPYYKNYSSSLICEKNLKKWFDLGFQFIHPSNRTGLLDSFEPNLLHRTDLRAIKRQFEFNKTLPLWRPILKNEVDIVFDIRTYLKVGNKNFKFKCYNEGVVEINLMFEEPLLGKYSNKDNFENGLYQYDYHVDVSKIESLEMEITYYDLSKFGETKYLDIAEKKIYSLDLKNPDMDIYKLMNEYGMLEIDWED